MKKNTVALEVNLNSCIKCPVNCGGFEYIFSDYNG